MHPGVHAVTLCKIEDLVLPRHVHVVARTLVDRPLAGVGALHHVEVLRDELLVLVSRRTRRRIGVDQSRVVHAVDVRAEIEGVILQPHADLCSRCDAHQRYSRRTLAEILDVRIRGR